MPTEEVNLRQFIDRVDQEVAVALGSTAVASGALVVPCSTVVVGQVRLAVLCSTVVVAWEELAAQDSTAVEKAALVVLFVQRSTAASVLEELADHYPIVAVVRPMHMGLLVRPRVVARLQADTACTFPQYAAALC